MNKGLLLGIVLLVCHSLAAQTLRLSLPQVTVANGASVTLPLTVADFDSIVSLQLSINWDTQVATYTGFTLESLPLLAIGDFQAAAGELRLSWFDNTGNGRSLPDGSVIANLTFTAMGDPGDFTDLRFTGSPLAVQIFKATGTPGVFNPVGLAADDGRIAIEAPLGFGIAATDVSCAGANNGNATVTLAVDPAAYTLSWVGPDNFTATGLQLDNLAGGLYELTITDQAGTTVFTYELIIAEPAEALALTSLEVTDTDCGVANGAVAATAMGGTSPYTYTLGNNNSATGNFTNLAAGDYELTVSDSQGCSLVEVVSIIEPNAPVVVLPATLQLCSDSLVLAPGVVGSYQWSTGATTQTLTVGTAGTYSVTVTNAANCTATASVAVVPGSAPTAVLETDFPEVCPGDSLQLSVSGGLRYSWLEGAATLSDAAIADPLAFPDTTTMYRVAVGNDCGTDTLAFSLLVYDILASAGQDTCIAPGDKAQLRAQGGIFYAWADNPYPVSDPTIFNPTAAPADSTTYQVVITDINGCVTADAVTVLVANDPVSSITPYNLITPNGDGLNDVLDFGMVGKFGTNSLKVYNRWGDLVYQKLNYGSDEERFDGLYKGQRLPAGNYFYVLAFRQGELKQTLTIIWE